MEPLGANGSRRLDIEDVGGFVRTSGLGIGRLVNFGSDVARVRYFQAPGSAPYIDQEHHPSDVTAITLPTHTRAFLHDGRRWRIGRVDGAHPQERHKYLIALPNSEGAVLGSDSFDVRWQLPITNPFHVLESVGGDSPVVYDARLGLLGEWSRQRAAAKGVEGLLLGSVELHRHQLDVVRRATSDPVTRYLLADEVGLGKTIEAGAIVWQFLAKKPDARVLVLAPDHLREQWARELLDRFRTDHYGSAWLRIRSHTDEPTWPTEPVDLLVVDEAHHVTRTGALSSAARQHVVELAHTAEALLLLSATPVRSNEAGFLDLLHLLDPQHYQPDDLEDFVRRVELRDRLALTHQALVPEIDAFDLSLYAEELVALFPDDEVLAELLAAATSTGDGGRPGAVGRVRDHLSETYRLHHRLLRTRRTPEIGATFRVRGRTRAVPFTLEVSDDSDRRRRELLDSVRIHVVAASEGGDLTADEAVAVFTEVAQRCGSLSNALLPLIELDDATGPTSLSLFRDLVRRGILPGWAALIGDVHHANPAALTDLGEVLSRSTLARGVNRTVLASAYTESALAAAAEMTRRWGTDRVALHLTSQSREQNANEVARWLADGPCSLLFCDSSAEEGINLQNADLLIHLDLPWEAFRAEQRIGRCDRHVSDVAAPIPSMVVVYGDQPYALGWFEFLADGCDVFTRSVSSLQYVLNDTERAVQREVLRDGHDALTAAVPGQAATLASELTRIVAHDALDAIDGLSTSWSAGANNELLASDERSTLTGALVSWLEGVGTNLRRPSRGAVRIERKPRPQVPFGLELAMAPSMETSLALHRRTSVEHHLPILRAGHPLVDAVASHLRQSDRGVAFALFRPARGQWPPVVVLRTDFLVSTLPSEALLAAAEAAGVRAWVDQLVQDALPPTVETVIMTSDGAEATHAALRQPYDKQRGDQNLGSRPDLFDRLTSHLDWPTTCMSALPLAQQLLQGRPSVSDDPAAGAAAVRERILRRADRERSRQSAGLQDGGADLTTLAQGMPDRFEPSLDVLGCGVIFVGDPSKIDQA